MALQSCRRQTEFTITSPKDHAVCKSRFQQRILSRYSKKKTVAFSDPSVFEISVNQIKNQPKSKHIKNLQEKLFNTSIKQKNTDHACKQTDKQTKPSLDCNSSHFFVAPSLLSNGQLDKWNDRDIGPAAISVSEPDKIFQTSVRS